MKPQLSDLTESELQAAKRAYEDWSGEDITQEDIEIAILRTDRSGGLFRERMEAFFAAWILSRQPANPPSTMNDPHIENLKLRLELAAAKSKLAEVVSIARKGRYTGMDFVAIGKRLDAMGDYLDGKEEPEATADSQ